MCLQTDADELNTIDHLLFNICYEVNAMVQGLDRVRMPCLAYRNESDL